MWIFTQDGFISAVDNKEVPGKLTVRARDEESLELLAAATNQEIGQVDGRDYPYRVHVTKEEFSDFLLMHVEHLNYPNFKDKVKAVRGHEFASACGAVWAAMLDVTDDKALGRGLYA
jgi:hypothetical protein